MDASDRLAALSRVAEKLSAFRRDKIAAGDESARAEKRRGPDDYDEIRRDVRDYASRISMLDETEGKRAEVIARKADVETKFPEKLDALRRQLKTLWGTIREREASTSFFRDTLDELKNDLSNAGKSFETLEGARLMQRCDAMFGAKYIERTDFMNLYEDLARYAAEHEKDIADALFAGKVKETLEELGYKILEDADGASGADTLAPGEVRYLESPYDGYRVMAKIDEDGALTARLVRVAEDGEHTRHETGDRDASDNEAGAKWCADFDRFLEKMKQAGLPMDVTLRKEPGEAEIMTIADTAEAAAGETRKTRKKHRRSSDTRGEARALDAGGESR
jgi:flagellar biosynthesis chaperone FliJ